MPSRRRGQAGDGVAARAREARDGYRESTDSRAELPRDLKRRGMRGPVVAVGHGALGFWAALRDLRPQTREHPDWVHKVANVLDTLPKSVQPSCSRREC